MLNDSQQRLQATDPQGSFIVQAPAGSGKTEILTQRYLRLLATVNTPEQIIALTFTRKAANEMRERILMALQKTATGVVATSAHQQQTFDYAAAALARDQMQNWQLLEYPGRLRIFTIDSLCQRLTQAIPLQEKQIPYAAISEKPQRHYLSAARACLAYAIDNDAYHEPLKILLQHLDNRQDLLLSLFSDLLTKRDQWLLPLHEAKMQDKALFEQALSWIENHELSRFIQSIPEDCLEELPTLACHLACIEANPNSPRYPLRDWFHIEQLNSQLLSSLAALLLTSQNTLRKSFDHHVGLKRGACDDKEYDQLKAASKILLSKLDEAPDFLEALLRVKFLPAPQYDPEQWLVLQALFTLLPLLAAHLHLIFSQHNEVDFSAISQQALEALGNDESPTDLTLYLDNQIHHLLVDEFQDTSIQQFQLLTKLVQGWQVDDGKTLFVVGDPMQSIYRFRAAEVGLFLRARQQGIGPVRLTPLELSCNFRSTGTIVNWVNQQFNFIFPQDNDIESGAVTFYPSVPTQNSGENSVVKAFQFDNREQEAEAVVKLAVEELAAHPNDNIAILVRSRTQLSAIMRVLREQQVPCQGVDINFLAKLPHLRDVWSLTQALLMPANRLAWLALLRSPWCGLSLSDLHYIAQVDKNKSVYFALSNVEKINGMSEEGRIRARFVYAVLDKALQMRHQQSLVDWIAHTLNALHLDKVLDAVQQDDLEQYWLLLEQFEQDGQIADLELFKIELSKLYSQQVTPSRLQIMTIHKSKGLEFDCVILPGLSGKSSALDTPLLRWLKLPTQQGDLLLLSPMKAAQDESCLLYDYLGKLDAQKNSYEQQRLLYVAVTRAKKRLYLFDNRDKANQGTFRHLLRHQEFEVSMVDIRPDELTPLPMLYHLPLEYYQSDATFHGVTTESSEGDRFLGPAFTPLDVPSNPYASKASFAISTNTPRLLGVITHELLQWICDHHPSSFEEVPWALANHQLKTLGFEGDEFIEAQALLKKQIRPVFNTPIGQWLTKAHTDERNEFEVLVAEEGKMVTRIIDRTFFDNGVRWIIDFKTGNKDEINHKQQVNHYAYLLAKLNPAPIRCGLYYLAEGHWVDWEYNQTIIKETGTATFLS